MFTILLLVLTVLQAPRNITIQGSSPVLQSPVVQLQADDTAVQGSDVQVQGSVSVQNRSGLTVTVDTTPDNRTIVVE